MMKDSTNNNQDDVINIERKGMSWNFMKEVNENAAEDSLILDPKSEIFSSNVVQDTVEENEKMKKKFKQQQRISYSVALASLVLSAICFLLSEEAAMNNAMKNGMLSFSIMNIISVALHVFLALRRKMYFEQGTYIGF
ncbi:MAG: hypothetical protein J6J42_02395 [Lachnospiraceae bacterium]|nr:hypothetical protein [Lachnospiraceae bacterium]